MQKLLKFAAIPFVRFLARGVRAELAAERLPLTFIIVVTLTLLTAAALGLCPLSLTLLLLRRAGTLVVLFGWLLSRWLLDPQRLQLGVVGPAQQKVIDEGRVEHRPFVLVGSQHHPQRVLHLHRVERIEQRHGPQRVGHLAWADLQPIGPQRLGKPGEAGTQVRQRPLPVSVCPGVRETAAHTH